MLGLNGILYAFSNETGKHKLADIQFVNAIIYDFQVQQQSPALSVAF